MVMLRRVVGTRRKKLGQTLALWGVTALSLSARPSEARATVCEIDPTNLIGTPISALVHVGTILTGGIGFGTTKSEAWRDAAVVISVLNYTQSATLITVDALIQPTCGDNGEVGPFNGPTLIAEGVAIGATTALLVGVLLTDTIEAESLPALPYAAPVEGGAVVGVMARF
jgi:hypothetical protein